MCDVNYEVPSSSASLATTVSLTPTSDSTLGATSSPPSADPPPPAEGASGVLGLSRAAPSEPLGPGITFAKCDGRPDEESRHKRQQADGESLHSKPHVPPK
jgi:hypothetical protein